MRLGPDQTVRQQVSRAVGHPDLHQRRRLPGHQLLERELEVLALERRPHQRRGQPDPVPLGRVEPALHHHHQLATPGQRHQVQRQRPRLGPQGRLCLPKAVPGVHVAQDQVAQADRNIEEQRVPHLLRHRLSRRPAKQSSGQLQGERCHVGDFPR